MNNLRLKTRDFVYVFIAIFKSDSILQYFVYIFMTFKYISCDQFFNKIEDICSKTDKMCDTTDVNQKESGSEAHDRQTVNKKS